MPESKTLRQIAVDYNYPSSSEDNNDVDALTVRSQESSDEDPPRNNKSLVKNKLQRNRGYGWCIGIVAVGLLVTVGVASYHFGSKHQQSQVIQPSAVPQPLSMPWSEGADPDKPQPKTTKGTGEQAGSYRFDEPVWRELHGFVLDDEGAELSSFDTIQPDSCTSVCDKTDNCNSVTICKVPNGVSCHLKTAKANGLTPRTHNKYCSTHIKSDEPYLPGDVRLNYPSDGETYTVYMYRAKNDGPTYNLENVNTASIGAVMWYLHNEVIYVCDGSGFFSAKSKWGDRKFAIDRIQRYKVSFKSTTPILEMGMNLSSYLSIDSGETTGPHLYSEISGKGTGSLHAPEFAQFGYPVGCTFIGEPPLVQADFVRTDSYYPNTIWYSLSGSCPIMEYAQATDACKATYPGGLCSKPTGAGNCTYSVEDAGFIMLDPLVGITPKWNNRAEFCTQCDLEGGVYHGGGCGLNFWDPNMFDAPRNQDRVDAALEAFEKKYPDSEKETDFPTPFCDVKLKTYGFWWAQPWTEPGGREPNNPRSSTDCMYAPCGPESRR